MSSDHPLQMEANMAVLPGCGPQLKAVRNRRTNVPSLACYKTISRTTNIQLPLCLQTNSNSNHSGYHNLWSPYQYSWYEAPADVTNRTAVFHHCTLPYLKSMWKPKVVFSVIMIHCMSWRPGTRYYVVTTNSTISSYLRQYHFYLFILFYLFLFIVL